MHICAGIILRSLYSYIEACLLPVVIVILVNHTLGLLIEGRYG